MPKHMYSSNVAAMIAIALLVGVSSTAIAQTSTMNPSANPPADGGSSVTNPPSASPSNATGSRSHVTNETQVKKQLEANGYTEISDIQKYKDGWTARAKLNDMQVSLLIHDDGKIETR